MKISVSACKVMGEKVAIVAVQPDVLDQGSEADRYIMHLGTVFEDAEVILYAEDGTGKARFYGRGDMIEALGEVQASQLPWQEMEADL